LVIGFIGLLQIVTTIIYDSSTEVCTSEITVAEAHVEFSVFNSRCLVEVCNKGRFHSSELKADSIEQLVIFTYPRRISHRKYPFPYSVLCHGRSNNVLQTYSRVTAVVLLPVHTAVTWQ
jgi:hypothetical protein